MCTVTIVRKSLFLLFILHFSYGIRISPKLDFGTSKLMDTNKAKRDFSEIGVVCTSSGCNTTKSEEGGLVKTNVIVQVQTNVDLKKNKTDFNSETPDIPIIVGTADKSRDNPIDIGNLYPSTSSRSIGNWYPISYPAVENSYQFPNYVYGMNGLHPTTGSDSFVKTQTAPSGVGRNWEIGAIEVKVPYVEPYNKQYFGEQPPVHAAFYSRTNTYNPQFRKSSWTPEVPRTSPNYNTPNCVCQNQNPNYKPPVGLQWNGRKIHHQNPPLLHIDDKLAPLN